MIRMRGMLIVRSANFCVCRSAIDQGAAHSLGSGGGADLAVVFRNEIHQSLKAAFRFRQTMLQQPTIKFSEPADGGGFEQSGPVFENRVESLASFMNVEHEVELSA